MYYPQKRSGSMPAGRARPRRTRGVIRLLPSDANYNCDDNWNTGHDFERTRDVGHYSAANPWGFFDMHGNVKEWTSGWYATYGSGAVTDPEGPATGSDLVLRNGSWRLAGASSSSAVRGGIYPSYQYNDLGFRLAFRDINKAPVDLNSTEPLTIAENQPAGTILGEFNATDPEGGVISYSLGTENWETFNHLFTLDAEWYLAHCECSRLRID